MIFFWMFNYIRVDFIIGQSNKAHYSDFFFSWKNLPFFQRFHDAGEIQKCDRTFITGTAHGCIWCFYSFTNSLGTLETPTTIFRRHFSNTEKITNQGTFCAIRQVSILTTYYLLDKLWWHTLKKAKKNHEPGSTYAYVLPGSWWSLVRDFLKKK